MKKVFPLLIFVLIAFYSYSQRLVAEDLKTHKIRKVKIGKRLSVTTPTDTLYPIKQKYNPVTKQVEYKDVGDWILIKIDTKINEIELVNNLTGERKEINISDINEVIFRREDHAKYKQLILAGFVGGICWTALTHDQGQEIAGISLATVCLSYMVATWTWTSERRYKIVGID